MFDKKFWDGYYENSHTPWDMGEVSPPIKNYIDQLKNKETEILIPGAGNAYEAEYLWSNGFKNIDVVDISEHPLLNLKKRLPGIDNRRLLQMDFFDLDKQYDLIIEQTFFCAILPDLRDDYAKKMHSLLKPSGKLIGLLFVFPLDLSQETPPYGGSVEEYTKCFSPYFNLYTLETSFNSHPARQGREAFLNLRKKSTDI
ncbi:MAG: methyltransferase [Calditrichaeota bacterium]|nr:MAG: methyltransferase [Calditrichota bacterium]MBL1203839.1 methyltransferase [Calditrichota bacterium]NOG43671.1 methyltransferase [Calditrichota bacterium]